MKIIDFEKRGNVVRFYLGEDNLTDYWGDDWDDAPYELNAGIVYDEYVSQYVDYAFPIDYLTLEPKDNWRWRNNSPYTKQDMKEGKAACLLIVNPIERKIDWWSDEFNFWAGNKNVLKIYFNDSFDEVDLAMREIGGTRLFTPVNQGVK